MMYTSTFAFCRATTCNNQPTVLQIVRGYCNERVGHNNKQIRACDTKIGLVNVCSTIPNLLPWVHPLQTVAKLASKSKLNPNQYSILFTTKCHCIISTWFEEATNSLLALATFISARGGDSLSCYLPWRELWRVENSTQKKLARIPSDSTQRPERYHEF